jgi:hypothetical protein
MRPSQPWPPQLLRRMRTAPEPVTVALFDPFGARRVESVISKVRLAPTASNRFP